MPSAANSNRSSTDLRDRVQSIIGRHQAEATRRVGLRRQIEERWLLNAAQINGRYEEEMKLKMATHPSKSKLFINQTRPKCNAWSGWLQDLLFPTDDKNWSIGPTPVPSLTEAADQAVQQAEQLKAQVIAQSDQAAQQAAQGPQDASAPPPGGMPPNAGNATPAAPQVAPQAPAGPPSGGPSQELMQQAFDAQTMADDLQARVDEGRKRAELMAQEIDDQLKEADYLTVKRDQIEDGINYGTGVTKGPVTGEVMRQGWKMQREQALHPETQQPMADDSGQPIMVDRGYGLQKSAGDRPGMRHVDIWSFFPDPDVSKISEGEGVYERHLFGKKRLRGLQHLPGFDKDAIRKLLNQKPRDASPPYLQTLRAIGDKQSATGEIYHVWEYTGCLEPEDIKDLAQMMGDQATMDDMAKVDPLIEVEAVLWFCDDIPLKFALYPYDSGEVMYSVFNFVKDPASIFGFGVPDLIRDPQRSLNAAWRAMMDNASYAVGPQIGIKKNKVTPENNIWNFGGGAKVWIVDDTIQDIRQAMSTFDIPIHQVEFANIIALSMQFIDLQAEMPQMGQGEQGNGVTQTAQGMAILMNSNNIVKRRVVRNYDDDVTKPDLRRFYDWNMQFSQKEEIKGDYDVDARGSSVLLMREMQSQTLMVICLQLGGHPVFGPMLDNREMLRMLFRSLGIMPGDVMLSDSEIDMILKQAAATRDAQAEKNQIDMAKVQVQGQNAQTAMLKAEQDQELAKANIDKELGIERLRHERAMMEMANKRNISLSELQVELQNNRDALATKERIFASEAAIQTQENEKDRKASLAETHAAASVKGGNGKAGAVRPGSGGYL